jgi:hypothetical protein
MASDVRVSFRGAAGREPEAGLALVLAAGRPWRVPVATRADALLGWYWPATTRGHVVYESRLELARPLLADWSGWSGNWIDLTTAKGLMPGWLSRRCRAWSCPRSALGGLINEYGRAT